MVFVESQQGEKVRVAARAEGCGSIAEGKFRGSVMDAIEKANGKLPQD